MEQTKISWIISFVVHVIILVLLLFLNLPSIIQQEFVEVFFGVQSSNIEVPKTAPQHASSMEQTSIPDNISQQSQTAVVLPERKLPDLSNDIFQVNTPEKLGEPQNFKEKSKITDQNILEDTKSKSVIISRGEKEEKPLPNATGSDVGISGGETVASKGVDYSLEWIGGGKREKISGNLPTYPKGTNLSAQIRLQVIVQPDGTITSVVPIQKADPRFEQAALSQVRHWKFEPLSRQLPQIEQTCIITFYFVAR